MRAKYINKTARRRTIRPDGDHYREMRKWKGDVRAARRRRLVVGLVFLVALAAVGIWYLFFRG